MRNGLAALTGPGRSAATSAIPPAGIQLPVMASNPKDRNNRELTLDEVAELLTVSPAYVAGLVERGEIPCRSSDGSPRVNTADALAFKQRDDAERRRVLDDLTSEAEKHRLGY
jgi:hypothetical protein